VGTRARKRPGYAFPYVGHGTAAARKHMECTVVFTTDVQAAERTKWAEALPDVMTDFARWQGRVLTFGNMGSLQWAVRAAYDHVSDPDSAFEDDPELPSPAQWRAFNGDIDEWLMAVHDAHPVALFVKPIDTEYGTDTDAWHEWTMERAATDVVPILEAAGDACTEVCEYVTALWQARQDALDAPAQEPGPTLAESAALLEALLADDTGERLEDRYTRVFAERNSETEYSLLGYFHALVEAGRPEDAIALCHVVLEAGPVYPSHWWPALADLLTVQGRLAEAEAAVREVVWYLESYSPENLVVCMDYHRATGEHDKEAVAFFAGTKLFSTFNYCVTKERAAGYGTSPKPKQVKHDYALWVNGWIGDRLVPREIKRIGHWLVLFGKLGSDVFAEVEKQIAAERDRRIQLRAQICEATNPAEVSRLARLLCEVPADADDMLRCAYAIHAAFPNEAFALYEHGLACEGTSGHQGTAFHRCANNILWQCAQSDELLKRADRALALATPWGRRWPSIYHNAAVVSAKLGRRDDVFRYIRLALDNDYDAADKLEADADFAGFHDDPEFAKLFRSR
jgi:tetratricopeptide (TPR) repeat protein